MNFKKAKFLVSEDKCVSFRKTTFHTKTINSIAEDGSGPQIQRTRSKQTECITSINHKSAVADVRPFGTIFWLINSHTWPLSISALKILQRKAKFTAI